jgi:hypothetical protein
MVIAETDSLRGCAFGLTGATTFRALVLPLGERITARLEGLVTMPGGGGPSGA